MNIGLSRRRISLMELYQEIIDEVFDFKNIEPYELENTHEGWKFDAVLKDELVPVYVYIQPVNIERFRLPSKFKKTSDVVNFGFEIGESRTTSQYEKTTYRDYIRILATVFLALNQYISKKKPDIVTFFSESKHGGNAVDVQKDDVYFKAIDRNKPSNYGVESIFDVIDKKLGTMLYRIDTFK